MNFSFLEGERSRRPPTPAAARPKLGRLLLRVVGRVKLAVAIVLVIAVLFLWRRYRSHQADKVESPDNVESEDKQ